MVSELGETDDPKALIPGDRGAIDACTKSMTMYGHLLAEAGRGLARIDGIDGWRGEAADEFHAVFHGHPGKWTEAGDAFHAAATALEKYAPVLSWAQDEAAKAIDLWNRAAVASAATRARHEEAQAAAAKAPLGSPIPPASDFVDPGEAQRDVARRTLESARSRLDTAGDAAAGIVGRARDQAPEGPSLWSHLAGVVSDVGEGLEDLGAGALDGLETFAGVMTDPMMIAGGLALASVSGAAMGVGFAMDGTIVLAPGGAALNLAAAVGITAGLGMAGAGFAHMASKGGDDPAPAAGDGGGGSGGRPAGKPPPGSRLSADRDGIDAVLRGVNRRAGHRPDQEAELRRWLRILGGRARSQ
jgi:hypothetical protein